jgi:hypothetical protein
MSPFFPLTSWFSLLFFNNSTASVAYLRISVQLLVAARSLHGPPTRNRRNVSCGGGTVSKSKWSVLLRGVRHLVAWSRSVFPATGNRCLARWRLARWTRNVMICDRGSSFSAEVFRRCFKCTRPCVAEPEAGVRVGARQRLNMVEDLRFWYWHWRRVSPQVLCATTVVSMTCSSQVRSFCWWLLTPPAPVWTRPERTPTHARVDRSGTPLP